MPPDQPAARDKTLTRIREASGDVLNAYEAWEREARRLDALMVRARKQGCSLREVAAATGGMYSNVTVYNRTKAPA